MPRDSETAELKLLKVQFEKLAHELVVTTDEVTSDGIEKIFDAQIRIRFGELISRVASSQNQQR